MAAYTLKYTVNTPVIEHIDPDRLNSFIAKILKDFKSGLAACWLHQKILIGTIEDDRIFFEQQELPDYIRDMVRIRIFNIDKEWHIWQSAAGFQARLREETMTGEQTNDDDTPFVDAEVILWGTRSKDLGNGFQEVREDRGTALSLPSSLGLIEKGEPYKRFVVTTRNYIDYNEIGQAGYVDSRFVDIQLKNFNDDEKRKAG